MIDLASYSDDCTVYLNGPAADIEDAGEIEDEGGELEDLKRVPHRDRRRRVRGLGWRTR